MPDWFGIVFVALLIAWQLWEAWREVLKERTKVEKGRGAAPSSPERQTRDSARRDSRQAPVSRPLSVQKRPLSSYEEAPLLLRQREVTLGRMAASSSRSHDLLATSGNLSQAILVSTILGPPRALDPYQGPLL